VSPSFDRPRGPSDFTAGLSLEDASMAGLAL
jgi:hypothetical protein